MKNLADKFINKVYMFFNRPTAILWILLIMSVQSLWFALTSIYPLPFDEYYHVGVIQIYAKQWLPFISSQPQSASLYGDITRSPSYLYHYFMSFLYRFLDVFISSLEIKTVILRVVNILLVVLAVMVFRKLFIKSGVSKRKIDFIVLVFALTPIVPFLAAHINYDNLLILLSAITFTLAFDLIETEKPDAKKLLIFISIGMLGTLVKYAFLPLFVPIFIYVIIKLINKHGGELVKGLAKSLKHQSTVAKILLSVMIILSFGLFFERIGINLVKYHKVEPSCEIVQSISVCKNNMPWRRNYRAKLQAPLRDKEFGNPVSYAQHWGSKMMRGYFAIFSHTPTQVLSQDEPFGPIVLKGLMPIPIVVASVVATLGTVSCLIYCRKIWGARINKLLIFTIGFYMIVLFCFNYLSYLRNGVAYAIQARYTYPILLPIFVVYASALNQVKLPRRSKQIVAVVMVLLYAWGGGITGWIIRSDSLWYWQNPTVISVNQTAQKVLKRVIPH